ncbi:MAG: PhzF family phenazine biosynthesis protein [Chitinophaga sp.]|uniref:PhzF family phenazine biosynthesis protein n=1 Tax=Chitinophaga sp. TaxID=1869181 RepID=UPI001B2BB9D8|nr:PhzF family phenazine biosynthesis protein [Chitinophaga sp.]MBO9732689.1 PhzF family phenazine biosynthesis protein [Chitinophaga sp.]
MKQLDYYVLDVFTDQPYKGNQLSVVCIDHELEIDQYHNISREFGYSETSFVYYSETEKVFKVRSFTPAKYEVAGAGHNLLGAVCLALIKQWNVFSHQGQSPRVKVKDIPVSLRIATRNELPYVGMKQKPAVMAGGVPEDIIAAAIGLQRDDLVLYDWPVQIVRTEVAHLMVPVRDTAVLENATVNKRLLKRISQQYGFEGFYLFTTNGVADGVTVESRFFNPGIGIDEDPATGTAAGPLAGYLEKLGYIEKYKDYIFLQGKFVAQPSTLAVVVEEDGIWVSGSSVIVMEGKIYL